MTAKEFAALIPHLPPSAGTTIVVGIDGCGGAGKSTLASAIGVLLPGTSIVHTDDFASWDNPTEWWPRLREQVLEPLVHGRPGRYQRYDWNERRLAEWHNVTAPIVLIEGVTATREECRPFLALKIWVECPRDVRLRRGLERDGADAEPLWKEWMAAEDRYCEAHRPRECADFIVATGPAP